MGTWLRKHWWEFILSFGWLVDVFKGIGELLESAWLNRVSGIYALRDLWATMTDPKGNVVTQFAHLLLSGPPSLYIVLLIVLIVVTWWQRVRVVHHGTLPATLGFSGDLTTNHSKPQAASTQANATETFRDQVFQLARELRECAASVDDNAPDPSVEAAQRLGARGLNSRYLRAKNRIHALADDRGIRWPQQFPNGKDWILRAADRLEEAVLRVPEGVLADPEPEPPPGATATIAGPSITGNTFTDCETGIKFEAPITSQGQSGGITAHTVNQSVTPDRSQFTRPLTRFQTQANKLLNDYGMAITGDQIQALASSFGLWMLGTEEWISKNMGATALAHFQTPGPIPDMAYPITGGHSLTEGQLANRRRNMTALRSKIAALEDLRSTGDYDPE